MGKGTDLWDDSALVDAFNQAMNKYKIMHGRTSSVNSSKELINNVDGGNSIAVLATEENRERDIPDTGADACTVDPNKETHTEFSCVQEIQPGQELSFPGQLPEAPLVGENIDGYSDSHSAEYNQLVSEYYELEEKRQKILQQLYQTSYGNYHSSSTYQANQSDHANASYSGFFPLSGDSSLSGGQYNCHLDPSYALCNHCIGSHNSCHQWNTDWQMSPVRQVPTAGQHVHVTGRGSHLVDPASDAPSKQANLDGLKKAISEFESVMSSLKSEASSLSSESLVSVTNSSKKANHVVFERTSAETERIISLLKLEASALSNENTESGKEKTKHAQGTPESKNVNMDTDLSAVLSAWYTAGFHTGRYLLEQSLKKGHH